MLFLDEPITGIGPMEKFPLIDTLRRSLEGRTVVVVDHAIVWQSRFREVAGNPHNTPNPTYHVRRKQEARS